METRTEETEMRLESKEKEMERMKQNNQEMKRRLEELENNAALTVNKPSLRDLPIVVVSAWRTCCITSPQTITFDSFVANFNGDLDLDSGVFTCFIPGFYTVSFNGWGMLGPDYNNIDFLLYKNGVIVPESDMKLKGDISDDMGVSFSRILILHMDVGDKLDLRMQRAPMLTGLPSTLNLLAVRSRIAFPILH